MPDRVDGATPASIASQHRHEVDEADRSTLDQAMDLDEAIVAMLVRLIEAIRD